MGVLVDSNANWTGQRPSPPKKKWMMHYLEEFPSSEDKPSSCYTNSVSVTPSLTSSLGGTGGSVITTLTAAPSPLHHHHTLPTSTTIINTTHLTTNHITFTNGLPTSLLQTPVVERKELTNGTTTHHHIVQTLPPNVQTQVISTSHGAAPPTAVLSRQYTLQIAPDDTALSSRLGIGSSIRAEPGDILSGESSRLMTHHTGYTTTSGAPHHTSYTTSGGLSTSPSHGHGMDLMKKRTGMSGIREVHNKLEKNRRAHLKECFEILKRQVPPSQEEKKSSNLSILHSAIRYIQVRNTTSISSYIVLSDLCNMPFDILVGVYYIIVSIPVYLFNGSYPKRPLLLSSFIRFLV
uniref:Max-binding protein MNT n=1 Tax=Cacopsylla melanoneura TaxID=428564 RepID=A0A8D8XHV0_9HEMI